MPGSLWMLGGYVPVCVGGVGMGILHALLMIVVRKAGQRSSFKSLFYFSLVIPTIIWGHNMDPISHTRTIAWQMLIAVGVYHVFVRALEGSPQSGVRQAGGWAYGAKGGRP